MTKRSAGNDGGAMSVGTRVVRVDGAEKASGAAWYPQAVPAPAGCLHAATVRLPVARARVGRVDAQAALAVPGVVRVLIADDVRGTNRFGLLIADQPVLAEDRVRGASDVVALVVGNDERAVRDAARLVEVDFEAEQPLVDPEKACEPDAAVVHEERDPSIGHRNLLAKREIVRGDSDRAFADAATVIEGEYRTERVEHAFMAPEAGIARRDDDGRLLLETATQWPEADLRQAAAALGEPLENLCIVQRTIGGAFGGREDVSLQILLLLAARELGEPVRMVWDRAESIRGHGKRHPFRIRHRLALDARGRFTGAEIDVLVDAGCYASTSEAVLDNALSQACGPYAIDNVSIRGRAVFTNNPYTCAMRGFGVNQMAFAMEQQVNKAAAALGKRPELLRRKNLVAKNRTLAGGGLAVLGRGPKAAMDAACASASAKPLPADADGWKYGRGLASALKNVGYSFGFDDHATATVTVTDDGATVRIGAAEVGQGVATVLTQIAADALAMAPARIRLEWTDTRTAPEAGSSSASRQTFVAGNAVRKAAAAARLAVEKREGVLPARGLTRSFTFHAQATGEIGRSELPRHAYAYSWSSTVADIGVEVATGRVKVLRVVCAVDAGRVVNPSLLEGQVEGGVVMGQGYALSERCVVRDGLPVALDLQSCGLRTAVDAATDIETVALETPETRGPFGARGIGEITMIAVVPAITAAVFEAVGVWMDEIPAIPRRIHAALDRAETAARDA